MLHFDITILSLICKWYVVAEMPPEHKVRDLKILGRFVRSITILTGHYSGGISCLLGHLGVLLGNCPMTSSYFVHCMHLAVT